MLTLPSSLRVFLAVDTVDMRKSFDALALLVEHVLRQDPMSGHLFVFVGRRRHMVRVLHWDRTGYVLWSKRLEKGVYRWLTDRDVTDQLLEVEPAELLLLLEGIDLRGARRRPRWMRTENVTLSGIAVK